MSQTIAPRLRTLLLLLLAVTGALLAGSAPVSAHAALTASDPQQGAVVKEAPAQVSLTFSERRRDVRRIGSRARPQGQARRHRKDQRSRARTRTR